MSTNALRPARELLLKEYRGVLSTHSKSMPGFPFGSVVPYCLDADGHPLILISRIAQHTHNLQKDPKCSMLVGEREAEDVQAVGRLTVMAEARKLTDEATIEAAAGRYYRYFPSRPTTTRPTISTSGYSNRYVTVTSAASARSTGSIRSRWPIPSPARPRPA